MKKDLKVKRETARKVQPTQKPLTRQPAPEQIRKVQEVVITRYWQTLQELADK